MFSAFAHSLNGNDLTNDGKDMSGIFKLAEALPHSQLTSLRSPTSLLNFAWTLCLCTPLCQQPITRCALVVCSLANNALCGINAIGGGKYTAEGINVLCEALKSTTTLTSLKYASRLVSIPTVNSL